MSLKIENKYKEIAEKLIEKYDSTLGHIDIDSILFLTEDSLCPKKYASTQLVKQPYTFVTNYKFIMTIYEPKIAAMNDAQLNILMLHELLHINQDGNGLIKHNLEDFIEIVSIYGPTWDTDLSVANPLD